MTRLAEVWRTNTVHRPSATPDFRTAACTRVVISCRPRPCVATENCSTIEPDAAARNDRLSAGLSSLEQEISSLGPRKDLQPRRHQDHAAEAAADATDAARIDAFQPPRHGEGQGCRAVQDN